MDRHMASGMTQRDGFVYFYRSIAIRIRDDPAKDSRGHHAQGGTALYPVSEGAAAGSKHQLFRIRRDQFEMSANTFLEIAEELTDAFGIGWKPPLDGIVGGADPSPHVMTDPRNEGGRLLDADDLFEGPGQGFDHVAEKAFGRHVVSVPIDRGLHWVLCHRIFGLVKA